MPRAGSAGASPAPTSRSTSSCTAARARTCPAGHRAAHIEPLTLDPASAAAAGSGLGSGGRVVVAEGTCMVRLLQVLARFYHHESCGQCTPCREGMGWLHGIVDRIVAGHGEDGD